MFENYSKIEMRKKWREKLKDNRTERLLTFFPTSLFIQTMFVLLKLDKNTLLSVFLDTI